MTNVTFLRPQKILYIYLSKSIPVDTKGKRRRRRKQRLDREGLGLGRDRGKENSGEDNEKAEKLEGGEMLIEQIEDSKEIEIREEKQKDTIWKNETSEKSNEKAEKRINSERQGAGRKDWQECRKKRLKAAEKTVIPGKARCGCRGSVCCER